MTPKKPWIAVFLTVCLITCAASLFAQKPEEKQQLQAFEHQDGIPFKTVDGRKLNLLHFHPRNTKPAEKSPWMLFVHGGGWRGGNKYNILRPAYRKTLEELTANGVACFSLDYRLTKNGITARESVVDCKDAARFLLKHADRFHLDPERYGVWGGSAGGHLSLMTALGRNADFTGDPNLAGIPLSFQCVASYFPLTTLTNPEVLEGSKFEDPEVLRHVLDGLFSEKPDLARLLSPTEYLTKDSPPILLLHGEKDPILSIKNSHHMMDVAEKTGANVQLLSVKNATHSFGGKNISPTMEEINAASARFILSHLTDTPPSAGQ
ncbi:MAG: alpha/beta fold hydrolase [Verrucomicrobiales bacterium]|nr:alpha/beta hydrolase [Verrucomicrobiota bacterium JB025]